MRSLRLYMLFLGIAIKSRLQYRSDLLVGMVSVFVLNWVNLALIWVMLSRFQSLQGWNYWEIVMLYALWLLSHSVYAVLFWHVSFIEDDVISGRFDQYMMRPMSPLVQFLGREVNYMGVADVIFAVAIFTTAYTKLGLSWAPWQWGFFAVAVLCGTVIEFCIFMLIGSLAFWISRVRALFQVTLTFNIMTQQFPIDIFGRYYRVFVTSFLPIAFINYYPLTTLLGKEGALGNPLVGYLSPAVAVVLALLTTVAWNRGIRSYSSAGN